MLREVSCNCDGHGGFSLQHVAFSPAKLLVSLFTSRQHSSVISSRSIEGGEGTKVDSSRLPCVHAAAGRVAVIKQHYAQCDLCNMCAIDPKDILCDFELGCGRIALSTSIAAQVSQRLPCRISGMTVIAAVP